VVALTGEKTPKGLAIDLVQIVRFLPESETLTARVAFYSAPGKPEVTGGVELTFHTGSGSLLAPDVRLVERSRAGTPTSAEEWDAADEELADVGGGYTDEGVSLTIDATGTYRALLRDPLTAVGLDLWTGAPGSRVQPSARVSIGDLTGAKPGLFPQQGTSVAADGSPQPWITQPVDMELYRWKVRSSAEAADPQHVTVNIGKYASRALEIRSFLAYQFTPLSAGASFPAYQIIRFRPDDTSATLSLGNAFRSSDGQSFTVSKQGKTSFALEFSMQLTAGYANVSVIVPGETDGVLLSTGFQYEF
jgi:hypothetical protein